MHVGVELIGSVRRSTKFYERVKHKRHLIRRQYVRLTTHNQQRDLLLLLHQLCNLAGYLPERCLVTGPRPFKEVRAVFELQDDENGRLDLQDRQQGDDKSEGRVEVSSAIHIAEGC